MLFEGKELESALEGILFAAGEPVEIGRLCTTFGCRRPAIEEALERLRDHYAFERRGVRLIQMNDAWQLCSAPDYADIIRQTLEIRRPAKLSPPALEVLTIIAYYQPATRAFVDQLRGVDSSYTVGLLQERGLIEECGRLQVPGRPRVYRTTRNFLKAFHLSSLEELPPLPGTEGDDELSLFNLPNREAAGGAVILEEKESAGETAGTAEAQPEGAESPTGGEP